MITARTLMLAIHISQLIINPTYHNNEISACIEATKTIYIDLPQSRSTIASIAADTRCITAVNNAMKSIGSVPLHLSQREYLYSMTAIAYVARAKELQTIDYKKIPDLLKEIMLLTDTATEIQAWQMGPRNRKVFGSLNLEYSLERQLLQGALPAARIVEPNIPDNLHNVAPTVSATNVQTEVRPLNNAADPAPNRAYSEVPPQEVLEAQATRSMPDLRNNRANNENPGNRRAAGVQNRYEDDL